ncbi:MAG TPA: tRNA pseudouridine(38-40) synthase TruA [Kofleriaceae bacterium]|nr:tRNA pseudouridine(38-40) synthase TruA [Kofleriaceae bacterium]
MPHIRLVVEYDGTSLCGWQRQINGPTVQGHLEEALAKMFVGETPGVIGASRTDAGVHARGQVASFRSERTIPTRGIRRGLNSLLPDTIAIRDASEVGEDFHPRFSATGKHYRYTILTRTERSPLWRDRAWQRAAPISVPAMQAAANVLVGVHDFAAFRAAGCSARTTLRRVDSIAVTRSAPDVIEVDVRGNAFLRNMVRIVVGTLVEVGTGVRPVSQVAEILASKDRGQAGITAPPQGLELIEVRYDAPGS